MVSRPIGCAESSGGLHFILASLVVAPHVKTAQEFRFSKFLHHTSSPSKTIIIYSQKTLEEYFRTFQACRIQLWLPFVHENAGSGVITKNIPKFRPTNFTSLKDHHHLQSEHLGRLFLYLSDSLNRMITSICLPDSWLWSYRRNAGNSPAKKISPNKLHSPQRPSSSIVRRPWKSIFTPFKYAESSYDLHLSMGILVLVL